MECKESDIASFATTRRQTLKMLARSAASTVGLPIMIDAIHQVPHAAHMQAQEATAVPYVLKYFSRQQAQMIEALSEVIIPADDHSPGAKAAKVFEYIDEIVSASPDTVRKQWTDGLAAMDRMARDRHGQQYSMCTATQQVTLMEKIGSNEEQPATLEEHFFVALKAATIDGYYTSKMGIHQELEYQGNTMVVDFPECKHGEHQAD